ncbi:cyclophilin-like fold protein [Marinobacterium aestuariivivens]|uniref:Cyclophilin-like fold protein n=1 Tax=Marinobacterium aestuariivivens TaxID=1698799 RepID=A0ABW2A0K9_9GAMM
MTKIRIHAGNLSFEASLNDSATADAILECLPIDGHVNVWGDEIYFRIPLALDEAPEARDEVGTGDLAYWPPGNAFCIFFGPTPASLDQEPRAASPVNLFGHTAATPAQLRLIADGSPIRVELADS